MTDKSNYGVLLKKATVLIGDIAVVDPPELMHESVESTNHNSGGYREFIPGGLRELSEFTATVNFTTISGIMTDVVNGTEGAYSIEFPDDASTTWSFGAYVTSFKPEAADASSPETLKATVTFRPTGTITIA